MIKVLFFARLREELGCEQLDIEWSPQLADVDILRQQLYERGSTWEASLGADNVICAVNQVQVNATQALSDGDEVAFFPPVTGG